MNNSRYSPDTDVPVKNKTKNDSKTLIKKNIYTGIKNITEGSSFILSVVLLVAVVFLYIEQTRLKESLIYTHSLIGKNDTKIAVIAFKPTIEAWNKIDPTGQSVRAMLDKTIKAYNDAGYIIIDSESVIGGTGNARFIDLMPGTIKGRK